MSRLTRFIRRKTPVGYIYRLIHHKLPCLLISIDKKFAGGTITPVLSRTANHLINDKHPLVLCFYLTLVTGGIYMFVSSAWHFLSTPQRVLVLVVCPLPYISLYLAATSDPGMITHSNYKTAIAMYPYDRVNFFPAPQTPPCRTCHLPKPARSKHCSVCKGCVAKHDHHCIWINNCVGLLNTRHFLFFLLSTNALLVTGASLSLCVLNTVLKHMGGIAVRDLLWGPWARLLLMALIEEVYIGAVFLMCVLCGILSFTFTIYHAYLIWAGTTTNETSKWADWCDDIREGMIFKADLEEDVEMYPGGVYQDEASKTWPHKSRQCLFRIERGRTEDLPRGMLWHRVDGMDEVDNIYDLGGKRNLNDVLWPGKL